MEKKNQAKSERLSRRDFLKATGAGAAALAAVGVAKTVDAAEKAVQGKRYAMVIDLQKCVGCGGCMIACKNENNVQKGVAWSFKDAHTVGTFPNVRYEYIPRLCNHCEKAPCVEVCPTGAMHKEDGGVTAHTPEDCIGCQSCMGACPYGKVIHFNEPKKETHSFWRNDQELIPGCTESAQEVAKAAKGEVVPFYNPDREKFRKSSGLRKKGVVEKCTFCDHRLRNKQLPYCVDRCPSGARIFGDLNDPNSPASKVLARYRAFRLLESEGTEPKVFYVRDFNPGVYETLEKRHKDMSEVHG